MGTTARGITYPDPSGVPSRAAMQTIAETTDTAIGASLNALLRTGRTVVTTNSSGNATITHPLGRIPGYDDAAVDTTTIAVAVVARTATYITIKATTIATGANYAGGLTVKWMVA